MATHGWRTGRTLEEQLLDEGSAFNYFQLLRLLDMANEDNQSPIGLDKKTQPGVQDQSSEKEQVSGLPWRIQADLDAAFPATEIRGIELQKIKNNLDVEKNSVIAKTSNYCIAGHMGPLPENYTDWIREQQRYGPSAMADFFDMFNHRINLLRYQVKKDSCLPLDNQPPEKGLLAPGISAAMGMLGKELFEQLPLSKRSIMSMSGLLAGRRISGRVIQRVIAKCFGIKTRVTDVVGAWRDTASDQIWKLGQTGVSNLGELCVLGQKNMDMQGRIRLEVGPLDIKKYLALLPDFEFSTRQIEVSIRNDDDLLLKDYRGKNLKYKYENPDAILTTLPNEQVSKSAYQVDNILLKYEKDRERETIMSPAYVEPVTVSKTSQSPQPLQLLRSTKFSGYLHRPFAALLKYLTNARADIEVVLEVDPDTLKNSYPTLITPEQPQDAFLRLGQSFWLGKPDASNPEFLKYSRTRFLIEGFGSGDRETIADSQAVGVSA